MWGRGGAGRLGQGHERDRVTPLMVGELREIKVVGLAAGDAHSLALADDGRVYAWGAGGDGRLGFETPKQRVPRVVPGLEDVGIKDVLAGSSCSGVLSGSGVLYTWGNSDHGQLGHGDTQGVGVPTRVEALAEAGVVVVSADLGMAHAGAVSEDGEVYTWGSGESGKLGHGSESDVFVPTRVESISGALAITLGANHSMVLAAPGVIYAFGSNRMGQLGIGGSAGKGSTSELVPTKVLLPEGVLVKHVSSGWDHVAAVSSDDKLLTWGLGLSGRLGHGSESNFYQPTFVDVLNDKVVRTVEAGGSHTAATVVHGWVDDDETTQCMACKALFTFVRRRHHCRRCGGLFCGSCSSRKFPLLSLGFSEAVRVCDKCFTICTA